MPDNDEKSVDGGAPKYRLLAIDDDPMILQAMGDYLVHFGFYFHACAYTEEDCAAYRDVLCGGGEVPDAIIADYRLPGSKNGTDLIAEVRQCFGAEIPAILFSGDISLDSVLPDELPPHTKLLHKPIRMQQLSEELKAILAA